MINQSMNYWPRDDIVVESILASVSCLPSREGESVCEMFLEKREGDCLLKKLEGLSHLGMDLPLYASTLRGGLRFQFLGSMLVFGGVPVPCFSVMGRLVSSGLCGRDLLLFGGFERQKK